MNNLAVKILGIKVYEQKEELHLWLEFYPRYLQNLQNYDVCELNWEDSEYPQALEWNRTGVA